MKEKGSALRHGLQPHNQQQRLHEEWMKELAAPGGAGGRTLPFIQSKINWYYKSKVNWLKWKKNMNLWMFWLNEINLLPLLNSLLLFHQSSLPNGKIDWEENEERELGGQGQLHRLALSFGSLGGLWAAQQPMAPPQGSKQRQESKPIEKLVNWRNGMKGGSEVNEF